MSLAEDVDELRQVVWAMTRRVEALELAAKRDATTATHRRPSGEMRLELEKADTQPSPAPVTEAEEAFRKAAGKLPR